MKSILNKNILIFLPPLFFFLLIFNHSIYSEDRIKYIDTVNLRKAFFLKEDNWDKFTKKINHKIDNNNRIGFICKIVNNNYEMHFYSEENVWNNIYSHGSISYKFNKNKELLKVKVYYQRNNDSYLLFDKKKRGKCDVYLFGRLYRKNLAYYFSIDSLKYLSINSILSLLDSNKIGKEILIEKDDLFLKEKLIQKIIIPSINFKYVRDGARDEFGNYVYILTGEEQKKNEQGLNCSGFVKEIADNYIKLFIPSFKWLKISDLKQGRTNERKNNSLQQYDLKYDPFFGLDWVKNIADNINKNCNYKIIKAEEYNTDTNAPYFKNRGFNIEDLKEILFRDQQKDSTYFYILIFNRLRNKRPIIPEHHHLSVIVPYFKDYHFYLRVFESAEETNFTQLIKIHKDEKVTIIKVPIPLGLAQK